MKITKSQLKQIIKEETLKEFGFGGNTGQLAAVAGQGTEEVGSDSPDSSTHGPEQTAEDSFVGILNNLGHLLDEWEQKTYHSDEDRYKRYFEDIQNLVEQYDPCAHRGKKCDEAHPNQSHEECIEVSINDSLYEEKKYEKSFYTSKEDRAKKLINKGVPEDVAYGVADVQMSKAGKKKTKTKKRGKK